MYNNNQEVFDTVAKHLLNQGRISESPDGSCGYRGQDGMKCAIGVLIPDDLFREEMEGVTVEKLIPLYSDIGSLFSRVDTGLLNRLQLVHDTIDPYSWKQELRFLASRYDLNMFALE